MSWGEFLQVVGLILIFIVLAGLMLSIVLDEVCDRLMSWFVDNFDLGDEDDHR